MQGELFPVCFFIREKPPQSVKLEGQDSCFQPRDVEAAFFQGKGLYVPAHKRVFVVSEEMTDGLFNLLDSPRGHH